MDNEEIVDRLVELVKIKKDLKYYLETNEEKGVVYIPKFVIEKMIQIR